MVEFVSFLFSDPMWWIPLLVIPVICCAVVGIKFPKYIWIAPIAMMVLGAISMWFHVPLTDYFRAWAGVDVSLRDDEFWGIELVVWFFWLLFQFFSASFFTLATWGLKKLSEYRRRRITPILDSYEA